MGSHVLCWESLLNSENDTVRNNLSIPELSNSDIERFWSKVARGQPLACWYWHGWVDSNGYARFDIGRVSYKASRIAYFLLTGCDLGHQLACHTCDDTECVNPHHIWPGDDAANAHDMALKGRATRGEKNPRYKLTELEVREIRASCDCGRDLATQYNVSEATISMIRNIRTWKHVS